MPVDNTLLSSFGIGDIFILFKLSFIILAVLYFIFSLIVVRQVNLMAETVITEGDPILKALSILHAGLALGLVVLFIGFL